MSDKPENMAIGVIAEYNPFHNGHAFHIRRAREMSGGPVVAVMSGHFTQRGDAAIMRKHARAAAAVKCGVDLVLELPLPCAVAGAEYFALGAVGILAATGVVGLICFGSECGDAELLAQYAARLTDGDVRALTKNIYQSGVSYPAARQRAMERAGLDGHILQTPNNILGIEYIKAINMLGAQITPISVKREGAAHDQAGAVGGVASASHVRALLLANEENQAAAYMPRAVFDIYRAEKQAGRAPAALENSERGMISYLRRLSPGDFARVADATEGLGDRIHAAVRRHNSLSAIYGAAKTKRYTHSRIRRIVLCAYLGLYAGARPASPPYIRPLAFNDTGRGLLAAMRGAAAVPVLTRPSAPCPSDAARELMRLEERATDLYNAALPAYELPAGEEYRISPVYIGGLGQTIYD